MQDGKDTLEVDDVLQPQLPWSIKRLILWIVLYCVIGFGVIALFGPLMAYFNHVNGWNLTVQDVVLIGQTYSVLVLTLASLAFLFWQCKKVDLSFRTIWGAIYPVTQVRYIIFALTFGVLISLLWNWKIVNFDKIPAKHPDAIFYSQMIVMGLLISFQEELYFRGMLYRTLRKCYLKRNAILISAIIFTAYHIQFWFAVTNLSFVFLYGVVTAFLVERTNSLTASFLLHVIANLVAVVVIQHREFLLL